MISTELDVSMSRRPVSSSPSLSLSPAKLLAYLSSFVALASGHALPRQTPTVALHELNVLPYPLATPAPDSPFDLRRRQFNTVCGYVGGDPGLPATCSAGSHCAVDVDHGAIGCCPDAGGCTQGVFTGCVDRNSPPQPEINPYVYTCQGGNVCYKNSFEGGYFQYGCGSASDMGTTVQASASGRTLIQITSLSVDFTATVSSLSEPTTLGTKLSSEPASDTSLMSESTATSRTATTASDTTLISTNSATTKTSSQTSSETSSERSTETSTGTSTDTLTETSTETASKTSATDEAATSTDGAAAAPEADEGDGEKKKHTGAIVGGTISGVAALVAFVAVGFWLWRKKNSNQRQGPGVQSAPEYLIPESRDAFQPLASNQEMDQVYLTPPPNAGIRAVSGSSSGSGDISDYRQGRALTPEPYTSPAAYGYGPGYGPAYGPGTALGGSGQLEHDQVPLTRETQELNDSTNGYGAGLVRIDEETERPSTESSTNVRSRGEGGPFFQQSLSQNRAWL